MKSWLITTKPDMKTPLNNNNNQQLYYLLHPYDKQKGGCCT